MKPSQPILAVQSCWPQEDGYCFELRRKRLPRQSKDGHQTPSATVQSSAAEKTEQDQLQLSKNSIQRQLDNVKFQLQGKEELEEKLKLLQEENASLVCELQALKESQQSSSSELQSKVDALNLEKQKLEDQLLVLKAATTKETDAAPSDVNEDPAQLLEQVQSRYEIEIRKLTNEVREKQRLQQEMDIKLSEMVGYLCYTSLRQSDNNLTS